MSELRLIYTKPTDIYEVLPRTIVTQITNDNPGKGSENDFIYTERLKSAENTVDSYFSERYKLPLIAQDGTVPPEIKDAVLTIAKYKLMARRNALNPSVESEYQNAMSWLKDISTGKANIALPQIDGTFDTSNATKFQHGATYGSLF